MKRGLPRLLIVDDLSSNQLVAKVSLESLDIHIDMASSGYEAMWQVQEHEYFAILMDVNMPGLDGFETTALITRYLGKSCATPIIFLTAQDNKSCIERCYRVGGSDYIVKPFEADTLIAKVTIFRDLYVNKQRISEFKDAMMESAAEAVIGIDSDFKIQFANSKAADLLEQDKEALIGVHLAHYFDRDSNLSHWNESKVFKLFSSCKSYAVEDTQIYTHEGKELHVALTLAPIISDNKINGGVLVFRDIRERIEAAEKLIRLAQYDQLTGLYNRMMFFSMLDQYVSTAKRLKSEVTVHFIDLDHFKEVNDTFGHDVGDEVIKEAARRISSCLRDSDIIARLGGDEFGIIQSTDKSQSLGSAVVANRIIEALKIEFIYGANELELGCSIGIASYPDHAKNGIDLLKAADTAMYNSKDNGRNQYCFFSAQLHEDVARHMTLVIALKHALKNKEFSLVYQPQIDALNHSVIGLEALIRWNNPALGHVTPDVFIPIAEQIGLISEIGQWVLNKACRDFSCWILSSETAFSQMHVAVNISVKQMNKGDLTVIIKNALSETELNPQSLKLEITESLLMENPDIVATELHEIRELGIELALDDFGTGYSSLSYLSVLPLRWMKIDRCFITDITNNPINQKIVLSTIRLAESLGYEVIVEGVETQEELDYVIGLGCRYIQGFYYSKPLDVADVELFVRDFPTAASTLNNTVLLPVFDTE